MAQLKIKQIQDFVSGVEAKINALVGTATGTAIADVQADVDANAEAIALNTAKVTNVSTNLAVTESTTTNIVTSSDGTDATLTGATTLKAGLMTKAIFDEHVANNAKVGITTDQAAAIVANKDAIATEKGRINALLLNSTETLDTFAEIVKFIGELDTADIVGLSTALSTAVSNDAVHTTDISTNATDIGKIEVIINAYGDIVGSDIADFATADQGALADSALQDASAFDAKGSADAAKTAANEYTDGFINALGTAAYSATGDFATAAQGLLAASALQNASAFDAAGSAATAKTEAIAAAKTYTDTTVGTEETARIAADADLQGQIDALSGVNSDEVVATWASKTSFNVKAAFKIGGHVVVFVNGLQIHEAAEGIDGWRSLNGRDFTVEGLGYDLEDDDHIIVSGTLA